MSPRDDRNATPAPDVDRLARSMLLLHGGHDDDHTHGDDGGGVGSWSKAPAFGAERAAALREATQRDRERYLTSGLASIDCRFCHVTVAVKKLGLLALFAATIAKFAKLIAIAVAAFGAGIARWFKSRLGTKQSN